MEAKKVERFTSTRILKWVGIVLLVLVGAIAIMAAIGAVLYYFGPAIGKWFLSQWSGMLFMAVFMVLIFTVVMMALERRAKKAAYEPREDEPYVRRLPSKKNEGVQKEKAE